MSWSSGSYPVLKVRVDDCYPNSHPNNKISTGQDIYFHLNHPIKWIRLTGIVVAIDDITGRTIITVDDSSGVNIEATWSIPLKDPLMGLHDGEKVTTKSSEYREYKQNELTGPDGRIIKNIDVGSVVKIRGKIGIFRGRKQLHLTGPKAITLLDDTNEEVKCWNDTVDFKSTILMRPWLVTGDEETSCREAQDREMLWRKQEADGKRQTEINKQIKEKTYELREKMKRGSGGEDTYIDGGVHTINKSRKKSRRAEDRGSDLTDSTNRVSRPPIASRKPASGEYDALGF